VEAAPDLAGPANGRISSFSSYLMPGLVGPRLFTSPRPSASRYSSKGVTPARSGAARRLRGWDVGVDVHFMPQWRTPRKGMANSTPKIKDSMLPNYSGGSLVNLSPRSSRRAAEAASSGPAALAAAELSECRKFVLASSTVSAPLSPRRGAGGELARRKRAVIT